LTATVQAKKAGATQTATKSQR